MASRVPNLLLALQLSHCPHNHFFLLPSPIGIWTGTRTGAGIIISLPDTTPCSLPERQARPFPLLIQPRIPQTSAWPNNTRKRLSYQLEILQHVVHRLDGARCFRLVCQGLLLPANDAPAGV